MIKKLHRFFFFLLIVFSTEDIFSQILEKKISVNFENITIGEALKSIASSENISFSYLSDIKDLNKKVSLSRSNESLKFILNELFKGTKIQFDELNNSIIVKTNRHKKNFTVSGIIEDAETGEQLLSANIYDLNNSKGTVSNYYGFYSLTLTEGNIKLNYTYVGYNPITQEFSLTKDTVINCSLKSEIELKEVIIRSDSNKNALDKKPGKIEMSVDQAKKLPVFLGESDIMKTIQFVPGIKAGTEASSGVYVRGGSSDQNLVLLDGVPVYYINHLFGFLSVFNSDAIQSFSVSKGGFSSQYGGRLSSVIDIKMKEGNNKKFQGEAALGLLSSRLTLEGPIVNENTSFMVTARRTYVDLMARTWNHFQDTMHLSDDNIVPVYYFYDINAKINHKFNSRNRIYYSIYTGQDNYLQQGYNWEGGMEYIKRTTKEFGYNWWNFTNALRWNCIISDKLFSNTTLTYTKYNSYSMNRYQSYIKYSSGIYDWGGKIDFDYLPLPRHTIKFGTDYVYHTFNPGVETFKNAKSYGDTVLANNKVYSHEIHSYIEDNLALAKMLKLNAGLHFSGFSTGSKNYVSIEPRVSCNIQIIKLLTLQVSATKMTQYIQLLTTSNIGMPTDIWVPATSVIKPQKSWLFTTGAALNLKNKYSVSIEAYYKPMSNLVEYKEYVSYYSVKNDWESRITSGKGSSKGLELLLCKNTGKLTGWIGYTLGYTDRQFNEINLGGKYPYKYDRRHDLNVVATYKKNEMFDFAVAWVFGTGYATTFPEKTYAPIADPTFYVTESMGGLSQSNTIESVSSKNAYRMPFYHRLDIGFNFHKQKRYGLRTISCGIYNTYSRFNPVSFQYYGFGYRHGNTRGIGNSLFPAIPYISYSLKF